MNDFPLGDWHCSVCVKKNIESGIHSVSEGLESVKDAREVEVSDADGMRKLCVHFVFVSDNLLMFIIFIFGFHLCFFFQFLLGL